jgi:cysteine desulfurase/selenocysteine lyase
MIRAIDLETQSMNDPSAPLNIDGIRADFPALADGPFFDNGTVSLTPAPVAADLERTLSDVHRFGPPHTLRPDEEYPRREATMARIASFLGTSRERLALTRGVSEAFQTVLRGIDWRAGDELVITEDEEAALLLPSLHLRDSMDVKVLTLPFAAATEGPYESLAAVVTERTRLVALSHVTTTYGFRYPVVELCDAARSYGIPSFVDVAHSAGVVPLALDELGCDFAGVLSYKWMYGPYAAGALYVRPASPAQLELRYAGNRSEEWLDFDTYTYGLRDDARRFEYGPFSWSIVHAWAAGIDYLIALGRQEVVARTSALVERLREGLAAIPGVNVVSPRAESAGSFVTFAVSGLSATDVSSRLLFEHRIRVKSVPDTHLVRASLAVFVSDEEVECLVDAVANIATSATRLP